MIKFSPDFELMYQHNRQSVLRSPVKSKAIKNLQYSKQRFDSLSKPLGRFVLDLEAMILTAVDIQGQRLGTAPSKHAEAWLTWVNEEKMIFLAMMGDVGH